MTDQDTALAHYLGILEGVVAVLAIKQGMNPETMMGKAIEEITEAAGMETLDTERIIRERWKGRDIATGKLAAQTLSETLAPAQGVSMSEDQPTAATVPTMAERYAAYKQRLSEAKSMSAK